MEGGVSKSVETAFAVLVLIALLFGCAIVSGTAVGLFVLAYRSVVS